jgi:hypothetical protein
VLEKPQGTSIPREVFRNKEISLTYREVEPVLKNYDIVDDQLWSSVDSNRST